MKYSLLVAASLLTCPLWADTARPEKANVLLVLADDLGWQDVKCYDIDEPSPYETPHMDRFAKQGVMFWQGYSPTPVCASTRCAILSGIHAVRAQKTSVRGGTPPAPYDLTGMRMTSPWQRAGLPAKEQTIAEVLKTNGYTTGHSGKWHVNIKPSAKPLPLDAGFDWSRESMGVARDMLPNRVEGFSTNDDKDPWQLDEKNYPKNGIFEDSLTFMAEHKDQPFFLFCAARLVHSPIQTRSKPLLEKYCEKLGIPFPSGPDPMTLEGQQNPYYCAMVEEFDYYFGNLINYLEATDDPRWPGHKLIENTYVILTSDNGGMESLKGDIITDNFPLDGGKIRLAEGGTRVPLIISGPEIPVNEQTQVMANGLDLFPTILSMVGAKAPEGKILDGCDLYPLLTQAPQDSSLVKEQDGSIRDTMMWHFPNSRELNSTIRVGDYKLVRHYDTVNNPRTKGKLNLYKLYETKDGEVKRAGIEELNNLAQAMPEKAKELDTKLSKLLVEMNADYPYFNPNYKDKLPNKEKVATVTSESLVGNTAKISFKENGAKVLRAQLIYTTIGGDANEEWYPSAAEIKDGSITATLPADTTHYVFNLIDENNFLVSYPPLKDQKSYTTKHKYSKDTLSVSR